MQKLSNEERQSLVSQHRRERDKRICDRIKAVLLRDEGWTYEQIAHVLLLTKEAIRQHIDDYEELHKLKPAKAALSRNFRPNNLSIWKNTCEYKPTSMSKISLPISSPRGMSLIQFPA